MARLWLAFVLLNAVSPAFCATLCRSVDCPMHKAGMSGCSACPMAGKKTAPDCMRARAQGYSQSWQKQKGPSLVLVHQPALLAVAPNQAIELPLASSGPLGYAAGPPLERDVGCNQPRAPPIPRA